MSSAKMDRWKDVESWCRKYFSFLMKEYGFVIQRTEYDFWGLTMILKNAVTSVLLLQSAKDQRFFVYFGVLEKGEYPKTSRIQSASDIKVFDLDTLLSIRTTDDIWPKSKTTLQGKGYKVITAPFEDQIRHKAELLKKHGTDILTGDFSVLKELRKITMAKIEEYRRDTNW